MRTFGGRILFAKAGAVELQEIQLTDSKSRRCYREIRSYVSVKSFMLGQRRIGSVGTRCAELRLMKREFVRAEKSARSRGVFVYDG